MIPVVITVYADRSFTFITKTPPDRRPDQEGARASRSGSGVPNKTKVAHHHQGIRSRRSPKTKMPDLNAAILEAADEHGCRHLPLHGHYGRRLIA